MKVWTCNDHNRHYPVPACSIVVAKTEEEARALLIEELRAHGIPQPKGDFTLVEVDISKPAAIVLADGDY